MKKYLTLLLIIAALLPTFSVAAQDGDGLSGQIVVSFQSNDTQTWEALCNAYMEIHPNVDCLVELKPSEGYQEWMRAQFAAGEPRADLVNGNVVSDLLNAEKFVDLVTYLEQENPYTEMPWEESFYIDSLYSSRDLIEDTMYVLNLDTVQVLWFYNKSIFEEVGITDVPVQPTWDQFVEWAEKIDEAGYIPVAIEGTADSFWQLRMGWLMRAYSDQLTRHYQPMTHCQPDDYCFREGIDDIWEWDASDPFNDDPNKATFNGVRVDKAFYDGEFAIDGPEYRHMYEQMMRIFGPYTPEGWLGIQDAQPLFLTQKAAMWLDGSWFFTTFEKNIKSLAEGTYYQDREGFEDYEYSEEEKAATVFELGTFYHPTMENPFSDAKTRTIEVNIGFWSVPVKDQAQTDLTMDFLMWATSPEGFAIYMENKLDPDNLNGGVNGPPIVKGFELPEPFASRFAGATMIGNTQKPTGTMKGYSRGVGDYQPTVREWTDLSQQLFGGDIDLDTFLANYQESIEGHFEEYLTEHLLWIDGVDALEEPEKEPEKAD
jgi:ABC-type glycerol-3-phosphate transport system substrate-binding protein